MKTLFVLHFFIIFSLHAQEIKLDPNNPRDSVLKSATIVSTTFSNQNSVQNQVDSCKDQLNAPKNDFRSVPQPCRKIIESRCANASSAAARNGCLLTNEIDVLSSLKSHLNTSQCLRLIINKVNTNYRPKSDKSKEQHQAISQANLPSAGLNAVTDFLREAFSSHQELAISSKDVVSIIEQCWQDQLSTCNSSDLSNCQKKIIFLRMGLSDPGDDSIEPIVPASTHRAQ